MDNARMAEIYKNRQAMTATPAELTLMLYNGAIRFCLECRKAIDDKNIEKANTANIKVQRIVNELVNTLDMNQPISQDWLRLYEYIGYCLIQANLKKDKEKLMEACQLLREFKDTWQEAMKLAVAQNASQTLAR